MADVLSTEDQDARNDLADCIWKMEKLPRNTPRIDRLRWIKHHHQAAKTEGLMVDAFTAGMLVQIYDALNEENQAKFLGLPLRRMVDVGWKLAS